MISLKSEITKKILNYFFINPHESLYVNELSRKLALDKRNLVKKVRELESEGILAHEVRGNLKLYHINNKHPFYKEYRKIVLTTVGLEGRLKELLQGMGKIKEAYIYGSYAKNTMDVHSDIDLLIVGDETLTNIQGQFSRLQKELDREINIVTMGEGEFRKRVREKDPFVSGVLKEEHIRII